MAGYPSEVLADSPKGWWRCQEGSGLIQDSSGNGNNATSSTGSFTYGVTSPITGDPTAKAIRFAATSSFSVPDHATLDVGNVFSLELWVKMTANAVFDEFFNKGGGAFGFSIQSDNRLYVYRVGVGNIADSFPGLISDTTNWHHCVVTKNAGTTHFYIDSVESNNPLSASTCVDTTDPLVVGPVGDATAVNLTELAVYGTALSQARVSAHYNAAAVSTGGPGDDPPIGFHGRGAGW